MFRKERKKVTPRKSFPRVSGDVPDTAAAVEVARLFSPRERGCSEDTFIVAESQAVFPA